VKDEFTILTVDDIPGNADVLRKTLEVEGYSISMALSGEVALKGPEWQGSIKNSA
jgi:CheY-like chemotaxis protein